MLSSGTVIKDRYKIVEVVGKGGQSCVYRARDLKRGYFERNEVAIKEMRRSSDMLSDMVNMDFFRQEVMILSKLRHPYLPRIFDIFVWRGNLYIVEEFIEGKPLESFLQKEKKIPPKRAVDLAIRVAGILDFLHQQNPPIYYRDLKPSNLLMQPGRLYLVDFSGCYIPLMGFGEGVAIRTKGYCPPEAYTTTTADASFDVYTLGMLLYRMVTGINVSEFSGPAPPLDAQKDNLPEPLVKVINKAINKNKHMRYHTMWEMKIELERVREILKEMEKSNQTQDKFTIPIKFKMQDIAKTILTPLIDLLVFMLIPLMIFRPVLSAHFPFASTHNGMFWYHYLFALIVLIIHILYRHWFDFIDFVSRYNRYLHFPIRNWFDIRPIKWLFAIEIVTLIILYFKIATL